MKPARIWILLLIVSMACSLPFAAQTPPSNELIEKIVKLEGLWQGALQDLVKNVNGQMNLVIYTNEKGFDGTVEFVFDGLAAETYSITGTMFGDQFEFREAGGRSFWGTIENDELHGFIAWDCFNCDHWGKFTLTRSVNIEPLTVPTTVPSSVSLIRFEGVSDSDTIFGGFDPQTGLPTASITITSDDPTKAIFIDADGITSGYHYVEGGSSATTDVQWTPWHGNGSYVLDAYLMEWTSAAGAIIDQQTIQVNVSGIPEGTLTVSERFSQLFLERFGFYPPAPAFTRYVRLVPEALDPSQWVSAVYYSDYSYELRIMDDGQISQYYTYTNFDNEYSICKPSGTIRMLAIIVDYGNTGTDPNLVINDLYQSLAIANQRWTDYATSIGLSQPIIQVELTAALAGTPSIPGQYLTVDEIVARTGYDPTQFDMLTEIDIDRDNLTTGQYGGLGVSLTGGCRPSGPNKVNIGMNINSSEFLNVGASIFEHEFIHAMGWQHWWANENGSTPAWTHSGPYWMPARMFGWTDLDGDGVIEIQDTTPYGIQ